MLPLISSNMNDLTPGVLSFTEDDYIDEYDKDKQQEHRLSLFLLLELACSFVSLLALQYLVLPIFIHEFSMFLPFVTMVKIFF